MNATKLLTALMAVLVVSAGAGAVTAASVDDTTSVDATYDDGTVNLTVTTNGTGVENVSVEANNESVGTTDANGSLTFETNATEELSLELTKNGSTIERTYTIDNGTLVAAEEETVDEEQESQLDATATYDNGTVDVLVTENGSAVENVSVTANGEDVGTTDANGSLTFETNATEELELVFEKGEMELEQTYTIEDGTLVMEEDEEESDAEGNVTLSANENASDRAHAVLATVQQWLNSGGEGNLGQQIQEAVGNDKGNSEKADEKGDSEKADEKGNSEKADEKGNSEKADEKGNSEKADEKGNSDEAKGNSGNAGGNGNGNGNGNADDAEDDEDEDETETETDA